jgi:[FeFe] hydrogenase H-cluster maturation GTPase HydF
MNKTPVGNRLHISIFGRRNAGKSTLINAITDQNIAIVSNVPGTTTDPVYKTMELLPIGPVVIIDTPGLDDEGSLGELRVKKSYDVLRKSDLVILVVSSQDGITKFEKEFILELKKRKLTSIIVFNKTDLKEIKESDLKNISEEFKIPSQAVSANLKKGITELKEFIGKNAKFDNLSSNIVGDLINPGDFVVLVTPIDKAAPKGRLILPQQQVIRDIIENDAIAIVTKEYELKETLENLNKKPSLVITDSQAFLKVSADTPNDLKLTSFSILIGRQKGDLLQMVKGLNKIKDLKSGSKVIIVEGCTHHRQADDIGKVKIPRWIRQISGGDIKFQWASGTYFPDEIEEFDLIVHCGGCMLNRKEMMFRMNYSKELNVEITNYGMLIAYVHGILKRALEPFPAASILLED